MTLLGHLFIFMCIYMYEYTSEIVIEERDFFANSKYVAVTQKCDFCSFANNRKNILARIQSKSIGISFFCTSLQKKGRKHPVPNDGNCFTILQATEWPLFSCFRLRIIYRVVVFLTPSLYHSPDFSNRHHCPHLSVFLTFLSSNPQK